MMVKIKIKNKLDGKMFLIQWLNLKEKITLLKKN
jgi:hypothetical protein